MRRWWVSLALLLSLGVNLGLLGAIAAGRWAGGEPADDEPPRALPGGGRELPDGGLAFDVPEGGEPAPGGTESAGEDPTPAPPAPATAGEPPVAGVDPSAASSAPADPTAATGPAERPASGPGEGFGRRPWRDRLGRRGFDGPGGAGGPGEPPLGRLADHLGLEGERRERFVALQRRFLAVHLEARRERAQLSAELHRELAAAEPDRARVDALVGRLVEAYAASERVTAEVVLASRELLDPAQERRYFLFLEHVRAGRPPGGGPGPGRHHRTPR